MPDALDGFEAYWAQLAERKQRQLNQRVPDAAIGTLSCAEVLAAARGDSLMSTFRMEYQGSGPWTVERYAEALGADEYSNFAELELTRLFEMATGYQVQARWVCADDGDQCTTGTYLPPRPVSPGLHLSADDATALVKAFVTQHCPCMRPVRQAIAAEKAKWDGELVGRYRAGFEV